MRSMCAQDRQECNRSTLASHTHTAFTHKDMGRCRKRIPAFTQLEFVSAGTKSSALRSSLPQHQGHHEISDERRQVLQWVVHQVRVNAHTVPAAQAFGDDVGWEATTQTAKQAARGHTAKHGRTHRVLGNLLPTACAIASTTSRGLPADQRAISPPFKLRACVRTHTQPHAPLSIDPQADSGRSTTRGEQVKHWSSRPSPPCKPSCAISLLHFVGSALPACFQYLACAHHQRRCEKTCGTLNHRSTDVRTKTGEVAGREEGKRAMSHQ